MEVGILTDAVVEVEYLLFGCVTDVLALLLTIYLHGIHVLFAGFFT